MSYVYIRSEPGLWTVGFYDPAGKWQPESDHRGEGLAAMRVNYLHGGHAAQLFDALKDLVGFCETFEPSEWLDEDKAIYEAATLALFDAKK